MTETAVHAPQILTLILWTLGLVSGYLCDGETVKVSFPARVVWVGVYLGLLYWGGFFS